MARNLNNANPANPTDLSHPIISILFSVSAILAGGPLLYRGVYDGVSYAKKLISQKAEEEDEDTTLNDEPTIPPIIECIILETPQRPIDIILLGEIPKIKEQITMTWPEVPAAIWKYPNVMCFTKDTLEHQTELSTGLAKEYLLIGLALVLVPLFTFVLSYKIRGWLEMFRRRAMFSSAEDEDLQHKMSELFVTPTPAMKEVEEKVVTPTLAPASEEQEDADVDVVESETQEETEQPDSITGEKDQVERELSDMSGPEPTDEIRNELEDEL